MHCSSGMHRVVSCSPCSSVQQTPGGMEFSQSCSPCIVVEQFVFVMGGAGVVVSASCRRGFRYPIPGFVVTTTFRPPMDMVVVVAGGSVAGSATARTDHTVAHSNERISAERHNQRERGEKGGHAMSARCVCVHPGFEKGPALLKKHSARCSVGGIVCKFVGVGSVRCMVVARGTCWKITG